jgi:membrane-bound ClpP family serine protease
MKTCDGSIARADDMTKLILTRLLAAALSVLSLLAAPSLGLARDGDEQRKEFYRMLHEHQQQGTAEGPTALLVTGVIGPGSYAEFHAAVSRETPTLVVIEGPGGVLGEAIQIGEEIRKRHIDTLVAAHHSCASACAVVFLSGHTRYLGPGASVGLHSASYVDGRSDPEATAVMAAYLRELGVPTATLNRMAHTAPSDIRWLTKAEQQAIGIRSYKEAK